MMQAPQVQVQTFPCPHCGNQLPATVPAGMAFPCYKCGGQVTAPAGAGIDPAQAAQYTAWAMEHGNTAAALSAAQGPDQDPRRANFSPTSEQVLLHTPRGRALVLGSHVDQSQQWCLRAQDVASGEVAWETPRNLHLTTCPGLNHVALRGSFLFVRIQNQLLALDPETGRHYWSAQLAGEIETVAGLEQGDYLDLHLAQGAVVYRTTSDQVIGLDQQNGQQLWARENDNRLTALPNGAGVLLRYSDGVELVAPSGQTLANLRGDGFEEGCVVGPYVVVRVEGYQGDSDDEGMLIVNGQTGEVVKYFSMPRVQGDTWGEHTTMVGSQLVFKAESGSGATALYVFDPQTTQQPSTKPGFFASLFGGGKKSWARPLGGQAINAGSILATEDAIVALGHPPSGGEHRVVVLNPQTLQPRYDSGPLPFGEFVPCIAVGAQTMAYKVPQNEDQNEYELRVVNTTTGQVAWTRSMGHWVGHYYLTPAGGTEVLVLYHDTDILLLRPQDGAVLGGYPKPA